MVVEFCDDEAGILFGKLDSVPLLGTSLRFADGFRGIGTL